jgi:hypothetical protein
MTDAEELAVLREFAAKTSGTWTCMGDFFVGVTYKGNWMARRISECKLRGVSYEDGSILAEADSLGPCILAARAKLAAERDAKDAPRLREAIEKKNAALMKIAGGQLGYGDIYAIAEAAIKETP